MFGQSFAQWPHGPTMRTCVMPWVLYSANCAWVMRPDCSSVFRSMFKPTVKSATKLCTAALPPVLDPGLTVAPPDTFSATSSSDLTTSTSRCCVIGTSGMKEPLETSTSWKADQSDVNAPSGLTWNGAHFTRLYPTTV